MQHLDNPEQNATTCDGDLVLLHGIKPPHDGKVTSTLDRSAAMISRDLYLARATGSGGVRALAKETKPRYFLPVFLTIPRETRFCSFS